MQEYKIDISVKTILPVLFVKQGEIGRKIKLFLSDSGKPYNVPTRSAISVWFSGAAGSGNYTNTGANNAVSFSGNEITVDLIAQMLSAPGEGKLCILINTSGGQQIGTWNIPYFCESVPGFDGPKAEQYYTAFSELIENAVKVAEKAYSSRIVALDPQGDGRVVLAYGDIPGEVLPTAEGVRF